MHQIAKPRSTDSDLRLLLRDAEAALSQIAVERGGEALDDLLHRMRTAYYGKKYSLARAGADAARRARQVRQLAHNHPYLTAGVSLAVAGIVGIVLWDRRSYLE